MTPCRQVLFTLRSSLYAHVSRIVISNVKIKRRLSALIAWNTQTNAGHLDNIIVSADDTTGLQTTYQMRRQARRRSGLVEWRKLRGMPHAPNAKLYRTASNELSALLCTAMKVPSLYTTLTRRLGCTLYTWAAFLQEPMDTTRDVSSRIVLCVRSCACVRAPCPRNATE